MADRVGSHVHDLHGSARHLGGQREPASHHRLDGCDHRRSDVGTHQLSGVQRHRLAGRELRWRGASGEPASSSTASASSPWRHFCAAPPPAWACSCRRIIQGAGGTLQPLSQAILLESFPEKRGQGMAAFGLGVVVAPIIGPTLGGWLTDNLSWRWVFYINLPVGILAVLMVRAFVEDPPYIKASAPVAYRLVGFSLMALWLATLQILLDKGRRTTGSTPPSLSPWRSPRWRP